MWNMFLMKARKPISKKCLNPKHGVIMSLCKLWLMHTIAQFTSHSLIFNSTDATVITPVVCNERSKTFFSCVNNAHYARCLGGCRFESCRGLRFFLCTTLVTCSLFHFQQLLCFNCFIPEV